MSDGDGFYGGNIRFMTNVEQNMEHKWSMYYITEDDFQT